MPAIEEVADEMPMEQGGMSIPIPAGLKLPDGKKDGDVWEVIAKVRKMGDMLMIDSIDGVSEEDAETPVDEAQEVEEDGDEAFSREISAAMK